MYYSFSQPQEFANCYFSNGGIYSMQDISRSMPNDEQCINIFIQIPQMHYFASPYCQQPTIIAPNQYFMSNQPNQMQTMHQSQLNYNFFNPLTIPQPLASPKKAKEFKKKKTKHHDHHKSKHSKKSHHHKPKKPPLPPIPTKIDAYCTFAITGSTYAEQKWYHCRTCGLTGNNGVCEFCAKKCHAGHDVYFYEDADQFYCDCPDHGNCHCMPKTEEDHQCTFEMTHGKVLAQPMYTCLDCDIENICQNCAIKFHKDHTVHLNESGFGEVCYYYKQKHGDAGF